MSMNAADFAVIGGALRSIAAEMGEVLMLAAYSTIVRESKDCGTCIMDSNGNVVAQAEMMPVHLNSMAAAMDHIRNKYDLSDLQEGEAFLLNNPYENGQHLNDFVLLLPVFRDGQVVAMAGNISHHLEVGGAVASSNANATEVYQEGLILPAMRINLERDLYGGPVEQIVEANVRCPDVVLGDLRAQVSAVLRGRERLLSLFERYGTTLISECMAELQDYSERLMRSVIAQLPDGEYTGDDFIDGFTRDDPLIPVHAKVTIRETEAHIDMSHSADQVNWPVNAPVASTHAAVLTVFAAMLGPDAITNAGTYRPISIETRKGSILDPIHPAPVRGRMTSIHRVATSVKRALGDAAPEMMSAAGSDSTCALTLSHREGHGYRMFTDIPAGGNGAGPDNDGEEAIAQLLSNTANTPVEAIERDNPFVRITEYSLIPDSGGAGRHRGGLGIRKRYQVLEDGVLMGSNGDRHMSEPWALAGGQPGSRTAYTIIRDGERISVVAAATRPLQKGDIFEIAISGGGGWGDPATRSDAAVRRDLETGRISPAAAERDYGYKGR